eukprot:1156916-Pelagomonas_calceolata.AAC.7
MQATHAQLIGHLPLLNQEANTLGFLTSMQATEGLQQTSKSTTSMALWIFVFNPEYCRFLQLLQKQAGLAMLLSTMAAPFDWQPAPCGCDGLCLACN